MFVVRGSSAFGLCRYSGTARWSAYRGYATRSFDPLRILFCGSDEFSIASLKALHDYRLKHPDHISSIDVVCRPGKRVGRGLKKIRESMSHLLILIEVATMSNPRFKQCQSRRLHLPYHFLFMNLTPSEDGL